MDRQTLYHATLATARPWMIEANAVKYVLNDSQIAEVIYRKAKSGSGEAETNVS